MVTLNAAPASGQAVTAGFHFDTPVRFDSDRIEATLKQCLRLAATQGHEEPDPAARANLMLCYVVGRWQQFAKSGFKRMPTEGFDRQAALLI